MATRRRLRRRARERPRASSALTARYRVHDRARRFAHEADRLERAANLVLRGRRVDAFAEVRQVRAVALDLRSVSRASGAVRAAARARKDRRRRRAETCRNRPARRARPSSSPGTSRFREEPAVTGAARDRRHAVHQHAKLVGGARSGGRAAFVRRWPCGHAIRAASRGGDRSVRATGGRGGWCAYATWSCGFTNAGATIERGAAEHARRSVPRRIRSRRNRLSRPCGCEARPATYTVPLVTRLAATRSSSPVPSRVQPRPRARRTSPFRTRAVRSPASRPAHLRAPRRIGALHRRRDRRLRPPRKRPSRSQAFRRRRPSSGRLRAVASPPVPSRPTSPGKWPGLPPLPSATGSSASRRTASAPCTEHEARRRGTLGLTATLGVYYAGSCSVRTAMPLSWESSRESPSFFPSRATATSRSRRFCSSSRRAVSRST